MSGSLNKCQLIGHVGIEPEIRSMQSGDRVANLSLATSERWKSKDGEQQERTQWHKVVCFNQKLVDVIEKYVHKGAKLYVEGAIETRSWEKDGVKQYTTEVVLKPFNGSLIMLDGKRDQGETENRKITPEEQDDQMHAHAHETAYRQRISGGKLVDEFEDEIPF